MSEVITNVAQLTPALLTRILQNGGHLPQGTVSTITVGKSFGGVSTIFPLRLRYSDEALASAPHHLLLKIPGEWLTGHPKEVDFYRHIAPQMPPQTVIHCYDARFDATAGHFHLLLEDLSSTHMAHPPSVLPPTQSQAGQIVDTLAKVHATWWDHPHLGTEIGSFPTVDFLQTQWVKRQESYQKFADFLGDRLSETRRQIFERALAGFLPRQIQRLVGQPHLTLIHGDPHIGNFLYPRNPTYHSLRIIDWKSWQVLTGVSDMAHLMAIFWFSAHRAKYEQPLLRRYHTRLQEYGVAGYSWAVCQLDYRLAIIDYLFYPVWQWSTGFIPELIWWHHLERIFAAFNDWNCEALLES